MLLNQAKRGQSKREFHKKAMKSKGLFRSKKAQLARADSRFNKLSRRRTEAKRRRLYKKRRFLEELKRKRNAKRKRY
ncbi:hypothetical protein GF336_00345 [Candidatus Woesearchaeota archaeon]|nr:hypothetical protein [Candidatus Woesearchaeota archaeon]